MLYTAGHAEGLWVIQVTETYHVRNEHRMPVRPIRSDEDPWLTRQTDRGTDWTSVRVSKRPADLQARYASLGA